tara:strand:- start:2273 stop:2941 length:669 start_codon:yes stop_codon:yes gene_type:complete
VIRFLFFLIVFSCTYKKDIENHISYLALGDSYTIGESVDYLHSYPVQLKNKLNFEEKVIDKVIIVAKTGWTTDELLDSLNLLEIKEKYDLVSLLIGVNNQYRGYDISIYSKDFEKLLIKAIGYSKNKNNVFVLSIPDYGVTSFISSEEDKKKIYNEINSYNSINKMISKKYNVMYFDITEISRLAEFDTSLVAFDNLHPSRKMYSLWVEKINQSVFNKIIKN